ASRRAEPVSEIPQLGPNGQGHRPGPEKPARTVQQALQGHPAVLSATRKKTLDRGPQGAGPGPAPNVADAARAFLAEPSGSVQLDEWSGSGPACLAAGVPRSARSAVTNEAALLREGFSRYTRSSPASAVSSTALRRSSRRN